MQQPPQENLSAIHVCVIRFRVTKTSKVWLLTFTNSPFSPLTHRANLIETNWILARTRLKQTSSSFDDNSCCARYPLPAIASNNGQPLSPSFNLNDVVNIHIIFIHIHLIFVHIHIHQFIFIPYHPPPPQKALLLFYVILGGGVGGRERGRIFFHFL